MSTIESAPLERKKSRNLLKRLTIRLKRKGDKPSDEQAGTENEPAQPELASNEEDAKRHMENMMKPTSDIDEIVKEEEEQGKSKSCTDEESGSAIKKRTKREHLLHRSKKYALTKLASRGKLVAEEDGSKGKEEDSDANIQAVEDQQAAEGKKSKAEKKKKKKEKKEKKEKRKSRKAEKQEAATQGQASTSDQAKRDVPATSTSGIPDEERPNVKVPDIVPATGRPLHHPGFIRPVSCPPQRFNGELSNYGLRAIEDAIKDVTGAIAPELQPRTPQMTLAKFVEDEQNANPLLKKPNLPSFDLPPPPSPPRTIQKRISQEGSGARSTRRPRSLAIQVSHENLAQLASERSAYQSPLSAHDVTLPVFNAQPSTVSDTNERVKVGKASIPRRLSSSASKRAQRRTVGPVPSFKLFASSADYVAVPHQLPPISPIQAHKRHAEELEENNPETTPTSEPEAKHPRLEEAPAQAKLDSEDKTKVDSEVGYDAIVEMAIEGQRIEIEKQNAKPKPSINPEEIKLLEQEQQEMLQPSNPAPSTEVTIQIEEKSSSTEAELQEVPVATEVARPDEHFEIVVAPESVLQQQDKMVEEATPEVVEEKKEEGDEDAEEEDDEEAEEQAASTTPAATQPGQQQQGQGKRRRRRGGRRNRMRKQNTRSNLANR